MAPQSTFPYSSHGPMPSTDILKHKTIALVGDFGADKPYEKIKAWIKYAGGVFTLEISSKVTHLVCSKKSFKASDEQGK